jgi:hypothetical protein
MGRVGRQQVTDIVKTNGVCKLGCQMKYFLAVVALTLALSTSAQAAPVAYEIDMVVTSVSGSAFGGVTVGSTFTATLDIDPLANDPGHPPASPEYANWADGTNFLVAINGTIIDENLFPFSPDVDSFFNGANPTYGEDVFPIDDPNGFLDLIIRFNMLDSDSSDVFTAGYTGISFSGKSQTDTTWGAIDLTGGKLTGTFDIHVVAVPIPATAWLFGSGLGMLGWLRRRKTA